MKGAKYILLMGLTALASVISGCGGGGGGGGGGAPSEGQGQYKSTVLVSDGSVPAPNTDPNLRNGWGVAFGGTSKAWVSDNGSQKATLYDGNGVADPLVVNMPTNDPNRPSSPTGIVSNPTQDFVISQAGSKAAFIFATEGGTILAWSPQLADKTNAVITYDDGAGGAVYKGLAVASNGGANFLYATDFFNKKVDVFDTNFNKVAQQFVDSSLPAGFAPFGIQAINNKIYVTYAQQDPTDRTRQVAGAGLGIVDVFDTAGNLQQRFATGQEVNAPWGIAQAPANFGVFSNDILVGNFGDGKINAYDPGTGKFLGQLTQSDGTNISIPGLWGIAFGNDNNNQPSNTLFYAAGPNKKVAGVYGRIDVQ